MQNNQDEHLQYRKINSEWIEDLNKRAKNNETLSRKHRTKKTHRYWIWQ